MTAQLRARKEFRRVVLTTAIALGLWLPAYLWASNYYSEHLNADLHAEASVRGGALVSALDNAMSQRLSLVRGLAAFVTVKATQAPDDYGKELDQEFPIFAKAYVDQVGGIRNIAVAPGFTVRYVYPTDPSNLKVVGNNLLADTRPGFLGAVQRAIASHNIAMHEPMQLIQGGVGLIARQVVYVDGYPWGAVGLVFVVDPLIEAAGFARMNQFSWAVRSGGGIQIAGDPGVFDENPVITRLILPEGYWEVALAPPRGWHEAARSGVEFQVVQGVLLAFGLLGLVLALGIGERLSSAKQELSRHTRDLTQANRELERFAYVAAHDLQEPLRAIVSFSQLVASTHHNQLDDDGRAWLGEVVSSAGRMKQLLHDIQLYLAESYLPQPDRPLNASKALEEAQSRLEALLQAKGAVLQAEPLPQVMADQRRLAEVFHVLLGNALEYASPDIRPKLVVRWHPEQGFAIIEIEDNGIGIDPRYQDRIFDVFQRLHSRAEHPGTGMGLAIARKMIERLGGRISVKSSPGAGSTFVLALPLADEAGR